MLQRKSIWFFQSLIHPLGPPGLCHQCNLNQPENWAAGYTCRMGLDILKEIPYPVTGVFLLLCASWLPSPRLSHPSLLPLGPELSPNQTLSSRDKLPVSSAPGPGQPKDFLSVRPHVWGRGSRLSSPPGESISLSFSSWSLVIPKAPGIEHQGGMPVDCKRLLLPTHPTSCHFAAPL